MEKSINRKGGYSLLGQSSVSPDLKKMLFHRGQAEKLRQHAYEDQSLHMGMIRMSKGVFFCGWIIDIVGCHLRHASDISKQHINM